MSDPVSVEQQDHVRHLILNRPDKRNAFNRELILAVRDAALEAWQDPDTFHVVVRGAGPTFSAGVDLFELGGMASQTNMLRPFRKDCIDMVNALEQMPKPVIASIQGGCIGLGAELALACDMRVMARDTKFSLPEVKLGLIPDVGGSSRLPAIAGLGNAKELIMTGRTIDANECHRMGIANRLTAPDDLDRETQALMDELLAASPLAAGHAKQVLDGVAKPTLAGSLELEVSLQQMLIGSDDFREAGMAFMEKRPPDWSGRTPAPAPDRQTVG